MQLLAGFITHYMSRNINMSNVYLLWNSIQNIPLSVPLKTNVDCEQLKAGIKAWGSVTAKGRKESLDGWTSAR